MQFKDVKIYAKRSNSEIFVWMSTFLGTVFIDIDYGLVIGLGVTFIFLLWWGYYPKVELLSPTDHEDLFTYKSEVRMQYIYFFTTFLVQKMLPSQKILSKSGIT